MKNILWMTATDNSGDEALGVSIGEPTWSHLESRIRRAFEFGGQVEIQAASIGSDEKISLGICLGMEANAGECRLIYGPKQPVREKSRQREWWEPGDAPFRGTSTFNDHNWDDRTVCRDVSVALQMFKDFYEHGDLTEQGLGQTRSVWDRKPR
jgi:hypothetical protein